MSSSSFNQKLKANVKLLVIATALIFGLWFAYETINILFLFFFAIVLTLVLNAPVMWLVSKKWNRTLAALLVFFIMITLLSLLGWLVLPNVLEQGSSLFKNLPDYYQDLKKGISSFLMDYPELQENLTGESALKDHIPSASKVVSGVGFFSFSIIGIIFLSVMFFSIVIYMLINPAPLLETYLHFFSPKNRPKAAHALARASNMMVGWMWSNLVVGTIEALAVFFFLTYMDVPGVWIWVGLALFAEMVPKLGLYIMAVPPVLIALSIDPMTALWVLIFYVVLNEITGDFITPRIRASTMDLHPVSTLFVMLAMASAFGLMGALIATPLTAFIKAYYEEFFLKKETNGSLRKEINTILKRKTQS